MVRNIFWCVKVVKWSRIECLNCTLELFPTNFWPWNRLYPLILGYIGIKFWCENVTSLVQNWDLFPTFLCIIHFRAESQMQNCCCRYQFNTNNCIYTENWFAVLCNEVRLKGKIVWNKVLIWNKIVQISTLS